MKGMNVVFFTSKKAHMYKIVEPQDKYGFMHREEKVNSSSEPMGLYGELQGQERNIFSKK